MEKAFNVVKTFLKVLIIFAALFFLSWTCLFDREQEKADESKMAHAARGFADCVYETGQHNGAARWYLHNHVVVYYGDNPTLRTELDAQGLCTRYSDAWSDARGGQLNRFADWLKLNRFIDWLN